MGRTAETKHEIIKAPSKTGVRGSATYSSSSWQTSQRRAGWPERFQWDNMEEYMAGVEAMLRLKKHASLKE
jgi:hypothetical protein